MNWTLTKGLDVLMLVLCFNEAAKCFVINLTDEREIGWDHLEQLKPFGF